MLPHACVQLAATAANGLEPGMDALGPGADDLEVVAEEEVLQVAA